MLGNTGSQRSMRPHPAGVRTCSPRRARPTLRPVGRVRHSQHVQAPPARTAPNTASRNLRDHRPLHRPDQHHTRPRGAPLPDHSGAAGQPPCARARHARRLGASNCCPRLPVPLRARRLLHGPPCNPAGLPRRPAAHNAPCLRVTRSCALYPAPALSDHNKQAPPAVHALFTCRCLHLVGEFDAGRHVGSAWKGLPRLPLATHIQLKRHPTRRQRVAVRWRCRQHLIERPPGGGAAASLHINSTLR
jgi:hypothetical protein